ncbi:MAG TPA: hypothetical protein VH164_11980 [Ktedonobacteraceae bacterium]|nr:hypothetical protein [Ktedonobacteraceae bacterium]
MLDEELIYDEDPEDARTPAEKRAHLERAQRQLRKEVPLKEEAEIMTPEHERVKARLAQLQDKVRRAKGVRVELEGA